MKKIFVLSILLSLVTSCTLEEVVNRCGNGVLDLGEQCDGRLIDGDVWKASGYTFDYDSTYCSQFCQILKKTEKKCGNGVLDEGEQCDGDVMDEKAWNESGYSMNYDASFCSQMCTFVQMNINECGNGILDDGEQCDGDVMDEKAWNESGYSINYDATYCSQKCTFVQINVKECGNGILDEGEQCDGDVVIENICGEGNKQIEYKSEMCSQSCQVSNVENLCSELNAVPCGNGVLDEGEQCDGKAFDETFCGSGKLLAYEPAMCSEDCQITQGEDKCYEPEKEPGCGNEIIEPDEECDGASYDENVCGPGAFELTYTPDVCSQKCKIVNLKDLCIIPDDKEYLKGGIASCHTKIEEKDGLIIGSVDLVSTKFAGDDPFELGMLCEKNEISIVTQITILQFTTEPKKFAATDKDGHAEFQLKRSDFMEPGHYYCVAYVRGHGMTVIDVEGNPTISHNAYFCGSNGGQGEPLNAASTVQKYNLGSVPLEYVNIQYEFDVPEAE